MKMIHLGGILLTLFINCWNRVWRITSCNLIHSDVYNVQDMFYLLVWWPWFLILEKESVWIMSRQSAEKAYETDPPWIGLTVSVQYLLLWNVSWLARRNNVAASIEQVPQATQSWFSFTTGQENAMIKFNLNILLNMNINISFSRDESCTWLFPFRINQVLQSTELVEDLHFTFIRSGYHTVLLTCFSSGPGGKRQVRRLLLFQFRPLLLFWFYQNKWECKLWEILF